MSEIISGMSMSDYQAGKGVGSGTLRTIISRSPAHALAEKKRTRSMDFGTIVHSAMEHGESWRDAYAVRPPGLDGRKKDGKAWIAEHSGLDTVAHEDAARADSCADAIRSAMITETMSIGALLDGAHHERVHYKDDPETGLILRARPDAEASKMILDWKITTDAREHAFASKVSAYQYDMQAALYLDVVDEAALFVFVVCEDSPPHGVLCYHVERDGDEHLIGRAKNRRALDIYARCAESGVWPCYDQPPKRLILKPWEYKEAY